MTDDELHQQALEALEASLEEMGTPYASECVAERMANAAIAALRDRLARPVVPMNEGELWSWVRSVMSQGADIRCDYDQGVHKGYEAYSARLDAAAAARSQELIARITEVSPAPVPLTYEHILSAIHSLGKEGQGRIALTFESGPYDIDEPTIVAVQFARAVINEFCRINGIGGER